MNFMIPRIKELKPIEDYKLQVVFDDGKSVIYDVGEDIKQISDFAPLKNETGLFQNVQLDQSRTCVFWSDRIDLPSDVILEFGKSVNGDR